VEDAIYPAEHPRKMSAAELQVIGEKPSRQLIAAVLGIEKRLTVPFGSFEEGYFCNYLVYTVCYKLPVEGGYICYRVQTDRTFEKPLMPLRYLPELQVIPLSGRDIGMPKKPSIAV